MSIHPEAKRKSVASNGTTVTYYDTQKEGARTFVLLHGTGGSAASHFGTLFPMLAARHRVIAIDFAPTRSGTEVTVDHLVTQVAAVIGDAHPGRPVTLVGYSLGAVVAAKVAAVHADLVVSLVLVAGWIKTDQQQLLRNTLWWKLRNSGSDAIREFVVYSSYGAPFLVSKCDADIETLLERVTDGPERDAHMRLNRRVDISEAVSRIQARTLVVSCDYDQMAPKHQSEALFGAIPDARLVSIPSGHAVVFERPAQLFSMIDSFATEAMNCPSGSVLAASSV